MATILITGANRGIGLALTGQYLARGDTVIATVRDIAKATALSELGSKSGGRLKILAADVTREDSLAAVARATDDKPIDILLCNAGQFEGRGALADPSHTVDMWSRLMATNVTGAFFTARTFAPQVIAAKGKIAIISSRMGSSKSVGGNAYAYRASKAAVSNIAANLAVELATKGVAVASYHPGWVQSDMGGAGADIDTATSARGLIARIDALSLKTSGAFEAYDGTVLQY